MLVNKSLTPNIILKDQKFISVTTFKRNGHGVATPVWFVFNIEKIYIVTLKSSWKVKRLQKNPNVVIAPCTYDGRIIGARMKGIGKFLNHEYIEKINNLLKEKYRRQYDTIASETPSNERVFIEITPTEVFD